MSQQTEAKETWVALEKKLLPYQRASVDKICKHFENSGKALLADEVGLGKTFVAKGVVAKLAAEHWEKNRKPFRVAYICPNQNVAAQNYPKFTGMYSSGVEVSEEKTAKLKDALKVYNTDQRVPTDCVYTRLCKWLITMGEKGCDIRGAMQEKERKLYLPEENEKKEQGDISPATESASGKGKPQMQGYARYAARVLLKKILDDEQFPVLKPLWYTAKKGCGSDELPKVFYAFNKAAVFYLTSQTTEDYRLSMQHLYTAEAKRRSVEKAVQFEALTPSTSFSTGNGTGTYKERALLFATLARYCGLDAPDWLKNEYAAQNKAVDGFQPAFSAYLKRLDGIFCEDMISAEVKELLCSNEEPNDFIVKLRKEFIKNNAKEFLNYDLVIMDEFQNFPELIGNGNNDKSDAAIIAQEIFGKRDCKVLLLSATPFEINDYIPEGFAEEPDDGNFAGISAERGSSDEKQVFDGFFKLIEFMIGEDAEKWTNQWSKCRSKLRDPVSCGTEVAAPSENPKDELQRLLHEAGIFRTERMTATLCDPVSHEEAVVAPSFAMRLKTNCFIGGNSKYRTAYGDSTPFPLTFGRGYSFSEEMPLLSEDWHKSLFLTEDQLSGKEVIPEGYHPRFEKLKEDILSAEGSGFSPAAMLWIPPSKPSVPLKGAFKGRKGYSKTLIFSHFRMTPLAFTYLLCGEAARTIKQYEQKEECICGIDDVIEKMMPEPKYHTTHDALKGYFVELFKGDVGRAAVRSVYPEKPYPCAVEQYCEDGCFKDMIEEYIDLLAGEYGKDAAMARAVRRAAGLRISSPKLYVRGDNPCRVSEKSIQAANRFAVGLFPENETGSDLTRRMGNIKGAFNSPFWPFVFTSTSIGAEGIDLHWYARNVVHWSIPARPLDIEQREGRVLRYNCHAFRLNKALGAKKENCVRMGWQESGMFETQLNFSKNSSCLQIISKAYFEEESSEQELWKRALEVVDTYRKTLGATKPPDGSESNEGVELDLSAWAVWEDRERFIDISPAIS